MSVVYNVDRQMPTKSGMHADTKHSEIILTGIKDNLEMNLTREPPIAGRRDIEYCNVQCTILEARAEDAPAITDTVRDALHALLHDKDVVQIPSGHGRFLVHGTRHAKPEAA